MNTRLFLLLLLATSAALAADSPKPAERPRLTDEMRRSVAATSSDSTGQAGTPVSDTLMMAPVRVTGTYQPTAHRPGEDDPKSQPFNWTEGGTFLKDEGLQFTTELKAQYNARHKGWDLLSFSW